MHVVSAVLAAGGLGPRTVSVRLAGAAAVSTARDSYRSGFGFDQSDSILARAIARPPVPDVSFRGFFTFDACENGPRLATTQPAIKSFSRPKKRNTLTLFATTFGSESTTQSQP